MVGVLRFKKVFHPAEVERRHARRVGHKAEDQEYRQQFFSMVLRGPGCWVWRGPRSHGGYGLWQLPSRYRARGNIGATRVAWFLEHGYLPAEDVSVCHRCDNPPCVNPEHLFLGSQLDNMRDCADKGRMNLPFASGLAMHKSRQRELYRRKKAEAI